MTGVYLSDSGGLRQLALAAQPLGRGRQGFVYGVEDDPKQVVKVYRQPDEERTKRLDYMMRAYRMDNFLVEPESHPVLVWPTALAYDSGGRTIGYLMPRIGPPEQVLLSTLFYRGPRLAQFPDASWRFLLGVARNLSGLVVKLHQRGLVVGDFSHNNIMVSQNGYVTLLDCDSIQFAYAGEFFACPTLTLEYAAPELQYGTAQPSTTSDAFALAVLVCRLLSVGDHPFIGTPAQPTSEESSSAENIRLGLSHIVRPDAVHLPPVAISVDVLPPMIVGLARRAFGRHVDLSQRPTADQWHRALQTEWQHVKYCARDSRHAFGAHLDACPWCTRAARALPDPFNIPEPPPDYRPPPPDYRPPPPPPDHRAVILVLVALLVVVLIVLAAAAG